MPITQILFDADGVLQTWTPGVLERLRQLPQRVPAGVTLDNTPDAISAAFLQAVFTAEQPCLRGDSLFADALAPLLEAWGVSQPLADVLLIWHAIEPYPDMFEMIAQLRHAGIGCALATNQQSVRATYMRKELGYDTKFDQSYYSCDLGVAKPEPLYFERIVADLGCSAQQLLFVDDRQDNVAAAQSVGLHGLVFEARKQTDPADAFRKAAAAWQLPLR